MTQGTHYVITGNTGEVTIHTGSCVLCRVVMQAAMTGTCVIKDGATTINTLPVATTAGEKNYDLEIKTSLLVTLSAMADHVVVIYK